MSTRLEAPGLSADWLNGWLAAVGATVLVPSLTLAWTDDAVPTAVFGLDADADISAEIARVFPTEQTLADSVIARSREGDREFPRKVSLEAYRERAAVERATRSDHLAASVSDLRADVDVEDLDHGAFDVSAPRGETLWSRARSCAMAIPEGELITWVNDALSGRLRRVQMNGLGFDCRRVPGSVQGAGDSSKVFADPLVEVLCFAGLALFPTRGDGRRVRQRGWTDRATQRGAFTWTAWRPFLDRWAIDAFLDMSDPPRDIVVDRYSSVPYQPRATQDVRRAYFAERAR